MFGLSEPSTGYHGDDDDDDDDDDDYDDDDDVFGKHPWLPDKFSTSQIVAGLRQLFYKRVLPIFQNGINM